MNKMICPNCQEELEFINKKYVCPCCDREWNEIILKSRVYFDSSGICDLNTILAQEYKIIEDLLINKQIYGVVFQIKDLYEIIIRIPVLIAASYIIKLEQDVKAKEFIFLLMSKPLSLGDWRALLNMSKDVVDKTESVPLEIKQLINCVRKLVNSDRNGDIVNWRNGTIAHGATKQLNDSELYDDVATRLAEITSFFAKNKTVFQSIKFVDSSNNELEGIWVENSSWSGRLFVVVDSKKYPLYPFFNLRSDGIYLFDRYIKKLQKTDIIEYVQSVKKSVNIAELNNIFIENTIASSECSNDLASYTIEERNLCEEFLSSGEYLVPDYLVEWLESKLEAPKDVFLLKMGKGMGKSFFARGLDPFSIDKIYIDDLTVKAFYINSTYNSRVDDFSVFVEDYMRKINKDTTIANNTFRLDINSSDPGKAFATFLNKYKEKYYSGRKLLFIFDGIDELSQQPDRNILDFVPNVSDLDEGIYVMVTCRECNVDKLSHCCKHFLSSFEGGVTLFTQEDEKYQQFVKSFYDLYIIKKSRLYCKRNGMTFNADFDKVDAKFYQIKDKSILNMALIRELIALALKEYAEVGKTEVHIDELNFDERLYEQYFESIKSYYGSKYYDKFINVLCCLSIVDRPVTLNELAVLSGNNNLNFAFLGFINSMRLFLGTSRGELGTYFSLDHADRKKTVERIFNHKLKNVVSLMINKICEVSGEKFDFTNIEDTAYYLCLKSIISRSDVSKEDVQKLFDALLQVPAILSWSQNYYENIKELEIIKHIDGFANFNLQLTRDQKLRVAYIYANAGLDELMINNYAQSEYYFKKSVAIYSENVDHENLVELLEYVDCLGKYATLLWEQGENEEALGVYDKVIQYTGDIHGKDESLVSKTSLMSEYICYCNIANSSKKYDVQKDILTMVEEELIDCEMSELKRRTEPFLHLCWFYYYRDTNNHNKALSSIKTAIELYSKCVYDGVEFYLSDLIKCYNFLLQYCYENDNFDLSYVDDYIRRGDDDITYIRKEKGYNDEETYLKYTILCSLIFLRAGKPKEYIHYKNAAFSFFESLTEEKRNNKKLTDIIKYYNIEEAKVYE